MIRKDAQSVSIFLFVGGVIWTLFLIYMNAPRQSPEVFIPGSIIVIFWGIRSFNLGHPILWVFGWAFSILWHSVLFLIGFAALFALYAFIADAAFMLGAIPLIWTAIALPLSIGGLCSDIESLRSRTRRCS